MYAVVKTGGKQYRVAEGDFITVEKLSQEPGSSVALEVLFLVDGSKVISDTEALAKASVNALILEHTLGEKALVFKYKKRKRYSRLRGHRQQLTHLEISTVSDKPVALKKATTKKVAAKAEKPDDKDVDKTTSTEAEETQKKPARARKATAEKTAAVAETESEKKAAADVEAEADDTDADTELDTSTEAEDSTEAEVETDTEAEADTDTEAEADTEAEDDAGSEDDNETDSEPEVAASKPARSRKKKDESED
ncbi:MAG: 50S ribosomal protein L21 [Coriobacteriales bacterium]|jgi:large subunit ribosomal protein L21|nr:50S ribosomal protein L21 [Coriobacteriales bacterium]